MARKSVQKSDSGSNKDKPKPAPKKRTLKSKSANSTSGGLHHKSLPKRSRKKTEPERSEVLISPCLRGFGLPKLQPAKKVLTDQADSFFIPISEEYQWKKKVLSVSFFNPNVSGISGVADEIMRIAERWTEKILLKFSRAKDNDPSADIRVTFEGNGQFFSVIGTQSSQGTTPSMNLGFRANSDNWEVEKERRRLILHEFGHALGLHHEHKAPGLKIDVKRIAKYFIDHELLPNKPAYVEQQFEALKEYEIDPKYKEYAKNPDPDSIMMYAIPQNMSEAFPEGIKGGNDLSPKDIEGIVKLYGSDEKFSPGPVGMKLEVGATDVKRAYWLFGKDKGLFHFMIDTPGTYKIRVSSETQQDDQNVIDPFAGIPLPYDPDPDIFKLGTRFEFYLPDPDAPRTNSENPIPGMGFTVEVPDHIPAGMDLSIFWKENLKFDKKGLYFLEISNATASVAKNDVGRFIVQILKQS